MNNQTSRSARIEREKEKQMSEGANNERKRYERSDASKALIGALTTGAIAIATKAIVLFFNSDSFLQVLVYFGENYSFWFQLAASAASGGFFATMWTKRKKRK